MVLPPCVAVTVRVPSSHGVDLPRESCHLHNNLELGFSSLVRTVTGWGYPTTRASYLCTAEVRRAHTKVLAIER